MNLDHLDERVDVAEAKGVPSDPGRRGAEPRELSFEVVELEDRIAPASMEGGGS